MTKSVKTAKALLFILGGNCWESWSTSMIRSLYSSTRTKWSEFIIVFNTNCKTKITKLPKRQESVKTSKALVVTSGRNGWNSCCASNIKCLSCSRRTKSTRFVTLLNTNYSILGLQVLNIPKKSQKLPNMTKESKHQKRYFSYWVGMADSHAVVPISSRVTVAGRANQLNL